MTDTIFHSLFQLFFFTLDVLVIIDLIYLCTLSLVPVCSCRLRNVLCDRKWRNPQTSMTNTTHWTSSGMHPLSHRVTLNHSTVTLKQFRNVFAVLSEMTVKLNSGYVSNTNKYQERLLCARARARVCVCVCVSVSVGGCECECGCVWVCTRLCMRAHTRACMCVVKYCWAVFIVVL